MIKKVRPRDLIWCVEGGDVKQVEVAEQMYRCSNETGIKYPNDDVMKPWYCWNGYLHKSRKAALRQAHRQLQNQLADQIANMTELHRTIQETKQAIKQLEEELE